MEVRCEQLPSNGSRGPTHGFSQSSLGSLARAIPHWVIDPRAFKSISGRPVNAPARLVKSLGFTWPASFGERAGAIGEVARPDFDLGIQQLFHRTDQDLFDVG